MSTVPRPPVVGWFTAYAVLFVLMYLAVAALSLMFFLMDPKDLEIEPVAAKIAGVVLLLMGLVFAAASALPLMVAPRPWVWVYALILICLGLSGCTIIFSVPLMIFWLKPEVKAYYGKQ